MPRDSENRHLVFDWLQSLPVMGLKGMFQSPCCSFVRSLSYCIYLFHGCEYLHAYFAIATGKGGSESLMLSVSGFNTLRI